MTAVSRDHVDSGRGQYWYVQMQHGNVAPVVNEGYLIESRRRSEQWHVPRAGASDLDIWTELGGRPARPVDEAAWKRAGAPESWSVHDDEITTVVSTQAGAPTHRPVQRKSANTLYSLGGRSMSMHDLDTLPPDPRRLKAWLLVGYDGASALAEYDEPVDVDFWLYETTSNLISEMPVSPQVRDAAFQMLAELPGMRIVEGLEDALGRAATAVVIRNRELGGHEVRVLIDPATGAGLGVEVYVAEPVSDRPWADPGLRLFFDAVETAHWTDRAPNDPPDAGSAN